MKIFTRNKAKSQTAEESEDSLFSLFLKGHISALIAETSHHKQSFSQMIR